MTPGPTIETERLLLRRWKDKDLARFGALNADPEVMEHLPGVLTREQSDLLVGRIESQFEEYGYGLWAVEIKWAHRFIGFCGLAVPGFETHFTPAVEIGWRFARDQWGSGFATEAAKATLGFGFTEVGLDRIFSWTVPDNTRSQQVMDRLGMQRSPDLDFDHPRFLDDDRLRRHWVWSITREQWESESND